MGWPFTNSLIRIPSHRGSIILQGRKGTMRKLLSIATLGIIVVALMGGLAAFPAGAADHLDAPFVKTDGRIDINDVYVFHPEGEDDDDDHLGTQNLRRT